MNEKTIPNYEEYVFWIRERCREKYLPSLSEDELDDFLDKEQEYIHYMYDLYKSLIEQEIRYDERDNFMGFDYASHTLGLKYEDFDFDGGVCWPEFDKMTDEERDAYYKEHPFRYQTIDDYVMAIRKWILWEYRRETEGSVDKTIKNDWKYIEKCYRKKTPIDLVATDLMYCCG